MERIGTKAAVANCRSTLSVAPNGRAFRARASVGSRLRAKSSLSRSNVVDVRAVIPSLAGTCSFAIFAWLGSCLSICPSVSLSHGSTRLTLACTLIYAR